MPNSLYVLCGKRAFDVLAAILGIIILSPILFLAAIAVKLSSPGPIFFSHMRIGRNFSPFFVCKFRTMVAGSDKNGPTITVGGDSRITTIGRLLRKTKLDEFPQLFNVLKGDMSLVGPRPEVKQYVEMFKDDYKIVLGVRPGITDYAAIKYRHEETVLAGYTDPCEGYVKEILPAKIELYKKYIAEQSFLTDFRIVLVTFRDLFA